MRFCEPRKRCDERGGGVPLTRMQLFGPVGFVLTVLRGVLLFFAGFDGTRGPPEVWRRR